MPNIKSSIKRVSVAAHKTSHNSRTKSSVRTSIKKFNDVVSSSNNEGIEDVYNNAVKLIDKAAAKGILHKNTAARKKSSLAKAKNAVSNK